MALIEVAVEYIEVHRAGSTDNEIVTALRAQGFSDETLAAAFKAAGFRPGSSASRPKGTAARRALVGVLYAVSALFLIGSLLLFVSNFRRASAAAEAATRR
jgi:hypothetical protein